MGGKRIIFLFVIILLGSGCITTRELTKRFLGVSTEDLELRRSTGKKKSFNMDLKTCFAKTQEVIEKIGGYIYEADELIKEMIAFYRTEKDTTPVGVFFTQTSEDTTEVEVVSPSKFTVMEVSKKIFLGLEDKLVTIEEEEEEENNVIDLTVE